jgi:hypothetical protein
VFREKMTPCGKVFCPLGDNPGMVAEGQDENL